MFNLLKNKLTSFVNSFSKKAEEKATEQKTEEESKKLEVKLSLGSKVKSILKQDVFISEKDVSEMLNELELSLLEADVAYEVAIHITAELRRRLVGMKVEKKEVSKAIKEVVRNSLLELLEKERPDILALAKEKKKAKEPFVIMFVGPNGAGKTTSIAKVVHLLQNNGFACIIALADTWRAASQEQGQEWARKLGIKAIGARYGADPASVGWDAVAHAKAKGIDVVLIDTAGRQETSKNLMRELEKINKVIKPDIKIYVGESLGGNAIVEQVREFDKFIGIDGVILTKADVDSKGGTAFSIYKATGKPIIYIGVGQEEKDLKEFDPEAIVDAALA
jgi:fused signal recognition particle receptor